MKSFAGRIFIVGKRGKKNKKSSSFIPFTSGGGGGRKNDAQIEKQPDDFRQRQTNDVGGRAGNASHEKGARPLNSVSAGLVEGLAAGGVSGQRIGVPGRETHFRGNTIDNVQTTRFLTEAETGQHPVRFAGKPGEHPRRFLRRRWFAEQAFPSCHHGIGGQNEGFGKRPGHGQSFCGGQAADVVFAAFTGQGFFVDGGWMGRAVDADRGKKLAAAR